MKIPDTLPLTERSRQAAAVLLTALLLAGCSQDFVSYDDVRTKNTAEERYPITVSDEAAKLSVDASSGSLSPEQVDVIIGFARQANGHGASSVSVLFASGNRNGRGVAAQAAAILAAQGIPRGQVSTAVYNGSSSDVTLSYYRKVARTKDCGDWSVNMAGNQFNELYPNYGCALQNNFAAMVQNPEDFETPRGLAPASGESRSAVLENYNAGEWSQKEQVFPDAPTTQASP
jgi:pilus assembly protein CpaD